MFDAAPQAGTQGQAGALGFQAVCPPRRAVPMGAALEAKPSPEPGPKELGARCSLPAPQGCVSEPWALELGETGFLPLDTKPPLHV